MVSPVLLKLHGSPEKVGSFHGNFCHVLLIFPLQLHFYKFLVPNLDQLMLWQISVCLDITVCQSLSSRCLSVGRVLQTGGTEEGGGSPPVWSPPRFWNFVVPPWFLKSEGVCMILPPNYLSPPSSPCNSARDPPGLSTGIQTGIRRVDCDVPFDCHIFQNQFPGFTRTRQITTESSSLCRRPWCFGQWFEVKTMPHSDPGWLNCTANLQNLA